MKSLVLFLLAFLILISSCQQQRPNILAPENVITDPSTNYVTNFVTNDVVIGLDYINSQIPTLSFEVPNTPKEVKEVFTDFIYKSIPTPIPSGALSMSVKSKWRTRPTLPISTNDVYKAFKTRFDIFLTNIGCDLKKEPELYLLDMDKQNIVDDIKLGIWFAIDFELEGKEGFEFETKELGQLMTNNKITIMFIGGCQTGQVWTD
ncbi:hypothetical protein [Brachyspira pilosicoli]|uniref:hypothetical protein n=1 Tax=Brachyspira pilosicoli TaxID=52584 RepID=UPI001CA57F34|nr:hypothetical protein [Brachyspira pilosicoli]MBW5396871.1 hypothetical protein [Brachyspira pilosicoli]